MSAFFISLLTMKLPIAFSIMYNVIEVLETLKLPVSTKPGVLLIGNAMKTKISTEKS
jgi:hypothetical protein